MFAGVGSFEGETDKSQAQLCCVSGLYIRNRSELPNEKRLRRAGDFRDRSTFFAGAK